VHVDAEVTRLELHQMVGSFDALRAEAAAADPVVAHAKCRLATERSTAKTAELRASVDAMERAAAPFFARWRKQLDEFVSAELRERSRERMDETRAQYDAIVKAAVPTLDGCDELNLRAADLVIFLGQDYNQGSLGAISGDVRGMTDRAAQLVARLDDCLTACETYVRAAALPGRLPVEPAGGEAPASPSAE
jgi:hypothetical protein